GKVNGKAEYGIDVRLPGMKIATVAASPVVGGKLVSVDDSKARAINGVRQIVRLDDAVAVVADHMWAAKQGLAALDIRWDDGPHGKINTADVVEGVAPPAPHPRVVGRDGGDEEARSGVRGSLPRARDDGAYELHGPLEPGPLRDLDGHASHHARPGGSRQGHRPAPRQGGSAQPLLGRRIRPAPRVRLRPA